MVILAGMENVPLTEPSASQEELAGLEETLDILSDPEFMASLRRSRDEAAAGDLVDLEVMS